MGTTFIPLPTDTEAGTCDIWDDDCPDGEKCMPWSNDGGNAWNALMCTPIALEPDQAGESCVVEGSGTSGIDTCDIGLMCWDVNLATLEGRCTPFCLGDPTNAYCADSAQYCAISGDSVLSLCLPVCDPIAQNCELGQGCFGAGSEFSCAPAGDGVDGTSCVFVNDCAAGFECVDGFVVADCEVQSCCTPFCTVGAQCLHPDEMCVPVFEEPPPGFGHVGLCVQLP